MLKILLITILLTSCATTSNSNNKITNSYKELATAWQQTSAELTALSYQAYNIAKLRLKDHLKVKSVKPYAIIVDVDETVLDNSPYQVRNLADNRFYDVESWVEWIELAQAKSVAGAQEFLSYASKQGVKVFYVTNRTADVYEATYKNLVKNGFPISRDQLLPKTENSNSKEERRLKIAASHNIIMLMGDSLGDFNQDFEKVKFEKRREVAQKYRNEFGRRYIVLPNAMYGEWIDSMYNYDHQLSEEDKRSLRRKLLEKY